MEEKEFIEKTDKANEGSAAKACVWKIRNGFNLGSPM